MWIRTPTLWSEPSFPNVFQFRRVRRYEPCPCQMESKMPDLPVRLKPSSPQDFICQRLKENLKKCILVGSPAPSLCSQWLILSKGMLKKNRQVDNLQSFSRSTPVKCLKMQLIHDLDLCWIRAHIRSQRRWDLWPPTVTGFSFSLNHTGVEQCLWTPCAFVRHCIASGISIRSSRTVVQPPTFTHLLHISGCFCKMALLAAQPEYKNYEI